MVTLYSHNKQNIKILTCLTLLSQNDVRSNPKLVQDVSLATDTLLESLGSLAVQVSVPKISLILVWKQNEMPGREV